MYRSYTENWKAILETLNSRTTGSDLKQPPTNPGILLDMQSLSRFGTSLCSYTLYNIFTSSEDLLFHDIIFLLLAVKPHLQINGFAMRTKHPAITSSWQVGIVSPLAQHNGSCI